MMTKATPNQHLAVAKNADKIETKAAENSALGNSPLDPMEKGPKFQGRQCKRGAIVNFVP